MSPDKLGRYMMSDEFLQRANAAIKKAVSELEAKEIKPAYVVRDSGTGEEPVERASVAVANAGTARAGKLGRYITSREFANRVSSVVEGAVRKLEANGLKPVYDEPAWSRAVLDEVHASGRYVALCSRLSELLRSASVARQFHAATTATASALLLAKTALPGEEAKFLTAIRTQLASARALPVLVEWASCLIDVELGSPDTMRDRTIIDDALFERRINAIRQELG
ncbi:hypothetical protein A9R05_39955 (plasmid) [Burkholderia sp. KK1]|nr:hypothetical protein A9R05_39955 [Burkholderia sp. KK1]